MDSLLLQIVTPEATRLRVEGVAGVRVVLADGPIHILPGHAPLIGSMEPGRVSYRDQSGDHAIEIEEGILQIREGTVTILTGNARAIL